MNSLQLSLRNHEKFLVEHEERTAIIHEEMVENLEGIERELDETINNVDILSRKFKVIDKNNELQQITTISCTCALLALFIFRTLEPQYGSYKIFKAVVGLFGVGGLAVSFLILKKIRENLPK